MSNLFASRIINKQTGFQDLNLILPLHNEAVYGPEIYDIIRNNISADINIDFNNDEFIPKNTTLGMNLPPGSVISGGLKIDGKRNIQNGDIVGPIRIIISEAVNVRGDQQNLYLRIESEKLEGKFNGRYYVKELRTSSGRNYAREEELFYENGLKHGEHKITVRGIGFHDTNNLDIKRNYFYDRLVGLNISSFENEPLQEVTKTNYITSFDKAGNIIGDRVEKETISKQEFSRIFAEDESFTPIANQKTQNNIFNSNFGETMRSSKLQSFSFANNSF